MLKRQETDYEAFMYRFNRLYGYGESHIVRNDFALETKALSEYETYYDYLKDLHHLFCPIYETLDMQEDKGPFTGEVFNDWLNLIYKDYFCSSYSFTLETYVVYECLGYCIAEDDQDQAIIDNCKKIIAEIIKNKRLHWSIILDRPQKYGDDVILVFSGVEALKKIRIKHFMNDIEAISIPEDELKTYMEMSANLLKVLR